MAFQRLQRARSAASFAPVSFKCNADVEVFSPCDPARQPQSVARNGQVEAFGDTYLARNLDLRSGEGEVADYAMNWSAPGKDDPCRFRHAVSRCDSTLDHVQPLGWRRFPYTGTIRVLLTAVDRHGAWFAVLIFGRCSTGTTPTSEP